MSEDGDEMDRETGELPWDGFRDGRIQNFLGLDWAGEKLGALERQIAQNEAMRDAAIARATESWTASCAKINAPLLADAARFRTAIEAYATENRSVLLLKGRKSREFPSGLVLKWRERKEGEYRWDQSKTPAENKAALLAWAEKEEGVTGETLTRATLVPDLEAIKKYLAALDVEEAGEALSGSAAPPGLEWVEPGETLSVTTKGESK